MKLFVKIVISILILGVVGLALFLFMLWQAFGPLHSTKHVFLDKGLSIRCEVEYNADFADVFYDVEFYVDQDEGSVFLGKASFHNEKWESDIETFFVGNWIFLIGHNKYEYVSDQLLGYNAKEKLALRDIDVEFNNELAEPVSISLDSIKNERLYVSYSYVLSSDTIFKANNTSLMFLPVKNEFRLIEENVMNYE